MVSFHCSACGGCCNSAPQLSLPELFHHQARFIGCLAIRRIARPGDAADREAFEALAAQLFESVIGPNGREHVLLAAQAFDDPARGSCPALGADRRCLIHLDHKPQNCRAVPLEALLPDRMQQAVLVGRAREAAYFGADCIALGRREGYLPLVSEHVVVSDEALGALSARRRDLAEDRRFWAREVFKLLGPELFEHTERIGQLPVGGFLSLSLAPALAVLASASSRCKARCVVYLNAQIELIAEGLGPLLQRSPGIERELSALLRANVALRAALSRPGAAPPASPEAPAVEAWLGLVEERANAAEPAQASDGATP